MKIFLCFLLCMPAFFVKAQDTIYKRNGEVVSVKVLEVNVKEISYKRIDLPDGPLMIVSKNDIRKIRYASGAVDSFAIFTEPQKLAAPVYVRADPNLIRSSLRKGIYSYQGQTISDRNLINLVQQNNLIWKNKTISERVRLYKTNRSVQYIVGYTGAAVGIAGLFGSMLAIGSNSDSETVFLSMAAASTAAGILISSQIVSVSYKLKRVKNADEVMELYNQLNIK